LDPLRLEGAQLANTLPYTYDRGMAGFDLMWSLVGLAYLAIVVLAIVGIFRTRELSRLAGGAWVLAVIVIPVFGVLAWFLLHSDSRKTGRG
jgi:amino acid transporter